MSVTFIDLTLVNSSSDALYSGIEELLKHLRPDWNFGSVTLKLFTEGITNTLVGCFHADDPDREDGIVVRMYGEKTELIIDRNQELNNMVLLHRAGCSAPAFARFQNGIAYGFSPGSCITESLVRDPHVSRLIIHEMVRMHCLQPEDYFSAEEMKVLNVNKEPCLFPKLKQFIDLSPDHFTDPARDKRYREAVMPKEKLYQEYEEMKSKLILTDSPSVFSHNDLLLGNIVLDKKKGKVTFIDYEYGAYNYEAFDLGNHFCEYAGIDNVDYNKYPQENYQKAWINEYLREKARVLQLDPGTVKQADVQKLFSQTNKFALMSHFFWGVWGLIQAEHSAIDFDYLDYAAIRLNEYLAKKEIFLQIPEEI